MECVMGEHISYSVKRAYEVLEDTIWARIEIPCCSCNFLVVYFCGTAIFRETNRAFQWIVGLSVVHVMFRLYSCECVLVYLISYYLKICVDVISGDRVYQFYNNSVHKLTALLYSEVLLSTSKDVYHQSPSSLKFTSVFLFSVLLCEKNIAHPA